MTMYKANGENRIIPLAICVFSPENGKRKKTELRFMVGYIP